MVLTSGPKYVAKLSQDSPEAEFLGVIGTKVLRVFLLAIHSHLYYVLNPPPPPPPTNLNVHELGFWNPRKPSRLPYANILGWRQL